MTNRVGGQRIMSALQMLYPTPGRERAKKIRRHSPAAADNPKKWFQVTRFPALLTAGIHGTEHRNWKRRTLRLSAPLPLVSPAAGSMPPGSPQPSSTRGQQLVTAFPSPATAPAFTGSIPGSKVPTCYFVTSLTASRARSARISTTAPGLPRSRLLRRSAPVALSTVRAPDCSSRFRSPSGFLGPSGSKRSAKLAVRRPAFQSARSPFAPRSRFYF